MRTFETTVEVTMTITVHDEDVIDRVVNNHDENGVPQPLKKGGTGWRDVYYDLLDAEEVVRMLAYNYVVNDAPYPRLDGWADLVPSMDNIHVEYHIDRSATEVEVREVEPSDA